MRLFALALALWATLCGAVAAAEPLADVQRALKGGDRAAALAIVEPLARRDRPYALALLGRIRDQRGERALAEKAYRKLVQLYNDDKIKEDDAEGLWAVALAAQGLGAYRDANDAFARAVKADPQNVAIELDWVELFLEKYDAANAETGLTRVLSLEPAHPRALERMARVRMEQGADFAKVEELLDRALAGDPKLTAVFVTRAAIALRDGDLSRADRELDAALAINPHELEALSVRAAVRFVADDKPGFERAVARVLQENPRFSRLYSIVGAYAEWEHRYDELVALADRALAIDPTDPYALGMRALNLLRVGREKEGLIALEAAWSRDRYNVHVYNTLNLYDDVISKEYETVEVAPFKLRLHKEERPSLEPYAKELLLKAYADMVKRYAFTPKGPLSIELYAHPEHFAVRTVGLPRVGLQGVCFGKVLTALSPRGGEFNWGQILWHELSHVFHVQRSESRVPRWFTEGLAEYETMRARPEWKREDDRPLYDALEQGKLPSLVHMNHAFTHARSSEELMVAYYASSVAVSYVIERFGFDKVPAMLSAWAEGLSSAQVFKRAIGVDLETLDREFREATRARLKQKYAHDFRVDHAQYGDVVARKKKAEAADASVDDRAAYALSLALAGNPKDAEPAIARVLESAPKQPLALFARVHLALTRGDLAASRQSLEAMLAAGHDGYQLRMLLARTAQRLGQRDLAFASLDAAARLDPDRSEAHELMLQLAKEANDKTRLEQALLRASFLDQHARAPLHALLDLLEARGAYPLLRERAEAGLYLDPERSGLHAQLALGLLHTGEPARAQQEARRAVALARDDAERARAEAVLAQVTGPQNAKPQATPKPVAREKSGVVR
jgi:tetratricopeptide (TPR) repeat protein